MLVVLTESGKRVFDDAMRLQTPWINKLTEGLCLEDIETTHRVIATIRRRLEGNGEEGVA
jgi:DNA-binding MarR family transcriptional regulator